MNNVHVERIEKTVAGFQADPAKARKTNRVEGAWNLIVLSYRHDLFDTTMGVGK